MANKTWRDHCAPIIAEVIKKYKDDPKELKRQLRAAYPYGERKMHPYKIWCSEVRRQLKIPRKVADNPEQDKLL